MGRATTENFYITARETSSVRWALPADRVEEGWSENQSPPPLWSTRHRRCPRRCGGPPSSADDDGDDDDHDHVGDGVSVRSCASDTQYPCCFSVGNIVVPRTACTRIRLYNIISK